MPLQKGKKYKETESKKHEKMEKEMHMIPNGKMMKDSDMKKPSKKK